MEKVKIWSKGRIVMYWASRIEYNSEESKKSLRGQICFFGQDAIIFVRYMPVLFYCTPAPFLFTVGKKVELCYANFLGRITIPQKKLEIQL